MTTTKKIVQGVAVVFMLFTLAACAPDPESTKFDGAKIKTSQQVKTDKGSYQIVVESTVTERSKIMQSDGHYLVAASIHSEVTIYHNGETRSADVSAVGTRDQELYQLMRRYGDRLGNDIQELLIKSGMSEKAAEKVVDDVLDGFLDEIKDADKNSYDNLQALDDEDAVKSVIDMIDYNAQNQTLDGVLANDAWH